MSNGRFPGIPSLPEINVQLTVQTFRDAIFGPLCGGSLTAHTLALPNAPHKLQLVGSAFPAGTIHVTNPGAILRFSVPGEYRIVGLAFQSANVPYPTAVPWGIGSLLIPGSPFAIVGYVDRVLEVMDVVPPAPPAIHNWYKFILMIQRLGDGAVGLIDPYIENEN